MQRPKSLFPLTPADIQLGGCLSRGIVGLIILTLVFTLALVIWPSQGGTP
ncbi:hypothetical protein [Armatimonas rosea]|uniref:Uncharacterized protein n=1 Tax=Armatimonas rosea TaxID=685828 RepID=A0A7W9SN24_ARMRO|nr:hypothetical protein [Armatimonas rosea]MBB6049655.1 hypothetical protein [Armatimonas rosea]